MKMLFVLVAFLSLTLIGCGKKTPQVPAAPAAEQNSPAEASAQPAENAPAPAPQPTAPAAEPANTQPINGVVDPRLTTQLRIFIQERGRLPENFRELAGARLDSVPRLGPGLMFVIDPTTQEVKIAAKQ